jgi:hypothetical protein
MSRERVRVPRAEGALGAVGGALPSLGRLSLNDRRVFYYDDDGDDGDGALDVPDAVDLGAPPFPDGSDSWFDPNGQFKWREYFQVMIRENWEWNTYYGMPTDINWPAATAGYGVWKNFEGWVNGLPQQQGTNTGNYVSNSPHYLLQAELADEPSWPTTGPKSLPPNWAAAWLPVLKWAGRWDEAVGNAVGNGYKDRMINLLGYSQDPTWEPNFDDLDQKTETITNKQGVFEGVSKIAALLQIIDEIESGNKADTVARRYGAPLPVAPGWLAFGRPILPIEAAVKDPSANMGMKQPATAKWRKYKEWFYYGPLYEDWLVQAKQSGVHSFKKSKQVRDTWKVFLGLCNTGSSCTAYAKSKKGGKRPAAAEGGGEQEPEDPERTAAKAKKAADAALKKQQILDKKQREAEIEERRRAKEEQRGAASSSTAPMETEDEDPEVAEALREEAEQDKASAAGAGAGTGAGTGADSDSDSDVFGDDD